VTEFDVIFSGYQPCQVSMDTWHGW